jgi:MarR family transcriptional regulator, organic hydroperoxide resistance regulator
MSDDKEGESIDSLGDVLEFMQLLWAVDHGLQSASKSMGRQFGITGPQRLVIRIVGRFPGISAGRLAATLHVHPSTLTGVLDRLVRRGLLERRKDPSDARRALFELKKKGVAVNRMRTRTVEAAVKDALAHVERADVDATKRVLPALAERLAAGTRRATGTR